MLRAGVRIKASWKNRLIVVLALLGDSSLIRRGAVPVAEGEEMLAVDRFNRKNNASGWDGGLLRVARRRWLHHVRRRVAYRAIRVG
jgi:hypothetical protein